MAVIAGTWGGVFGLSHDSNVAGLSFKIRRHSDLDQDLDFLKQ